MNNYLQEIPLSVIRQNPGQSDSINQQIAVLFPQLERLDGPLTELASKISGSVTAEQKGLVKQIYDYTHVLIKPNEEMLYATIEKEKVLKNRAEELTTKLPDPSRNKEKLASLAGEIRGMMDQIITDVETVNFRNIAKIKEEKLDDEIAPSFKKLWSWTLEVYFGASVSKYYWPEFIQKVFLKDDGKELKRRIIVFNYTSMTGSNKSELKEIEAIHSKILRDKVTDHDLTVYLDVIRHVSNYIDLYETYKKIKREGTDTNEVKSIREDESNLISGSLKLVAKRYEAVSEMQNLLLFIDSSLG